MSIYNFATEDIMSSQITLFILKAPQVLLEYINFTSIPERNVEGGDSTKFVITQETWLSTSQLEYHRCKYRFEVRFYKSNK